MSSFKDFLNFLGGKFERNLFGPIGSFFGNISDIAQFARGEGTGSNVVDSYINQMTGAGPTGVQLWQASREDNAYQRSVADMQAAGLNTALMYGGSSGGPSASSAGSQTPSGISDLLQLVMMPLEMQKLKAETKDIEASAVQKKSQTKGQDIDNAWKELEKKTAIDAKRASTELSRKRIAEIDQNITESEQRIEKMIAETNEIEERQRLEITQQALNQANAYRITELLEYEKLELQARTSSERASAAQAFANAAYTNGLISHGMIEFACRQAGADAEVAVVEAALASPSYDSAEDSVVTKVLRNIVSGVGNAIRLVSPFKHVSSSTSTSNVNVFKN